MKLYRGHRDTTQTVWATNDRIAAEEYADENAGTVHTLHVDRDDIAPARWLAERGFAEEWTDAREIDQQVPAIITALRNDGYTAVRGITDHTPMLTEHESFIATPQEAT